MNEGTAITREIMDSFGFDQKRTTPDHDDRGIDYSMKWATLGGLYICNNEPCTMDSIEGEFYTDEGEEYYVCLDTKEQVEEFEACTTEQEVIEFIEKIMN